MRHIAEFRNGHGEVYLRMAHHDERHYLYCEWIGFILLGEVLDGGRAALQWLQMHARDRKTAFMVNDNRRMRGSWELVVERTREEWVPAAVQAGLRANAIIRSPDPFTRDSAEAMAAVGCEGLLIRTCADLPEAEAWFQSLGNSRQGRSAA